MKGQTSFLSQSCSIVNAKPNLIFDTQMKAALDLQNPPKWGVSLLESSLGPAFNNHWY